MREDGELFRIEIRNPWIAVPIVVACVGATLWSIGFFVYDLYRPLRGEVVDRRMEGDDYVLEVLRDDGGRTRTYVGPLVYSNTCLGSP
jgi:hypothetical protein